MAIKRGPDGVPIDMPSMKNSSEPTTEKDSPAVSSQPVIVDEPTLKTQASQIASAPGGFIFDEPPTAPAKRNEVTTVDSIDTGPNQSNIAVDDLPTVVGRKIAPVSAEKTEQTDPMADPISGWLVVVAGPGKGKVVPLGYGQNSIGRGNTERVCINFGDEQISRQNHATISYDPRGHQFYLQPGSGTNMTYLEGQATPVLQPMLLESLSTLHIGDTKLRFVPLCGEQFSWEDTE